MHLLIVLIKCVLCTDILIFKVLSFYSRHQTNITTVNMFRNKSESNELIELLKNSNIIISIALM